MKIIITNIVPLNGGDASILLGTIDILKKVFPDENISFSIYANQAEISRKYFPQCNFSEILYKYIVDLPGVRFIGKIPRKISKKRFKIGLNIWRKSEQLSKMFLKKQELKILNDYKSADLIISTGGTYLVENYNLEPRLLDFEAALCTDTPLIFFTQSLGPFNEPDNRRRLKKIFRESGLIFVRDELSKKHLLELGVESNKIFISADAAFYLADKSKYRRLLLFNESKKIKKVAISVREWKHFKSIPGNTGIQNYLEAIRKITIHLVKKYNSEIVFISTCQGIPEYRFDDSTVAIDIFKNLPDAIKKNVTVDTDFHHPKELINIYENFDLTISTRMHAAILSMCAGTPAFPIAYEFKTIELFKQFGLKKWVHDIEKLDAESMIHSLDSFIEELPHIKQIIYNKVDEARKSAFEPGLIIKQKYSK
ncbi:MAG: polysaccharide pyruvyl transferase family protein [Actinomycetota bacterium]|nr:polysaccharide pyruvyl transferase family protein [Actinomycetota bacterium]